MISPASKGRRNVVAVTAGSSAGRVAAALCVLLSCGSSLMAQSQAPASQSRATREQSFFRTVRLEGAYTAWTIDGPDSTFSIRQTVLPAEIEILPDPRLRMRAGLELRSQRLGDTGSVSSTGLAGGWLDARFLAGSNWLLGAGGAMPFRDPSITVRESRLVAWLQETGLQLRGANVALDPMIEARAWRRIALGVTCRMAAGATLLALPPHSIYRGGDLPSTRGIAFGWPPESRGRWPGGAVPSRFPERPRPYRGWEAKIAFGRGRRCRVEGSILRPGNRSLRFELGSYLQARGEGTADWRAPSGGSLFRAAGSLSWGTLWHWTAGVTAWRTVGFGDLLGNSLCVRPGLSLGRAIGNGRVEAALAPSFGAASRDRSLRGIEASLSWELAR